MNNNNINFYADEMINKINECINEKLKFTNVLIGAIISNVNEDGSVDVYLPPDNSRVFTHISNQTPFVLNVGDSVELMLKDGSFNNCWVVAKHGGSNTDSVLNGGSIFSSGREYKVVDEILML